MTSILFRIMDGESKKELEIAKKYFSVVNQRTQCATELVIGRYSCLPYYKELERDLLWMGCNLINSYVQHKYIANFEYYYDVEDLTPKTWFDYNFHKAPQGCYIVKGTTNSKKSKWNTHCFAESKKVASNIAAELMYDEYIGPQGVIYREFVPLNIFDFGLNGIPYSNEFRLFVYKQEILSAGYYWSPYEHKGKARLNNKGMELAKKVIDRVHDKVNFYVLDIAETVDGNWILIEMNDGQQSGLSENSADELYRRLSCVLS